MTASHALGHYNSLSFELGKFGTDASVTPVIDGVLLSDGVRHVEEKCRFEPIGGYGGLLPSWFNYGPLDQYFLGRNRSGYWAELDGIYLLGCAGCGEVGCWPLLARVETTEHAVVWKDFRQPYRPSRDYSGFGPFVFEKSAYVSAVRSLMTALDSEAAAADNITERVCRLPWDLRNGSKSAAALVKLSGYLENPQALTRESIVAVLRSKPGHLAEWFQFSQDKRTTGGWYVGREVRRESSKIVVAALNHAGRAEFDDPVDACAEFIMREVASIAEVARKLDDAHR